MPGVLINNTHGRLVSGHTFDFSSGIRASNNPICVCVQYVPLSVRIKRDE